MVVTRPIERYKFIENVAAYETLSETHWNAPFIEPTFSPNWFVEINNEIKTKIKALKCYKSQINSKITPDLLKQLNLLQILEDHKMD